MHVSQATIAKKLYWKNIKIKPAILSNALFAILFGIQNYWQGR